MRFRGVSRSSYSSIQHTHTCIHLTMIFYTPHVNSNINYTISNAMNDKACAGSNPNTKHMCTDFESVPNSDVSQCNMLSKSFQFQRRRAYFYLLVNTARIRIRDGVFVQKNRFTTEMCCTDYFSQAFPVHTATADLSN